MSDKRHKGFLHFCKKINPQGAYYAQQWRIYKSKRIFFCPEIFKHFRSEFDSNSKHLTLFLSEETAFAIFDVFHQFFSYLLKINLVEKFNNSSVRLSKKKFFTFFRWLKMFSFYCNFHLHNHFYTIRFSLNLLVDNFNVIANNFDCTKFTFRLFFHRNFLIRNFGNWFRLGNVDNKILSIYYICSSITTINETWCILRVEKIENCFFSTHQFCAKTTSSTTEL